MDNDLKLLIDDYIASFLNQKKVKQYFTLEKEINENEYLTAMQNKLKQAQKNLALSINDNVKHAQNLKIYEDLKNEFYNYPAVVNYLLLKEDIYEDLKNLEEELNR